LISLLYQIRLLNLRSMRVRSTRYLLSMFGIVLGVAVILAITVTNQAALASIVKLFANTSGRSNLVITSANMDGTGFPDRILRLVSDHPGIVAAAPILQADTVSKDDVPPDQLGLGLLGMSAGGLRLQGIIPEVDSRVRDYRVTKGTFLSDESNKREIILVEDYAKEKKADIGDWFYILTPNGFERLKIVGLISREGPGLTNNGSFGVLPLGTLQELFNRNGRLDQIDIITTDLNPTAKDLELLQNELQNRLGEEVSVTFPASQGDRMTRMLQNYQIGLNFMSGIALFVGAFLIYNSFAMTVVERTREFGMLRTIGMGRNQVTSLIFFEAGLLGVIGAFLGVVMGVLLAQGLANLTSSILNQDLGRIDIPPNVVVTSAMIGVVVTFLAACIPALQAGRISPMEALRIRGRTNQSLLIRQGWKIGLVLLVVSIILLIANPFPYDVQFRLGSMTVFGLFSGVALLIPVTVTTWERFTRPLVKIIYGSIGSLGSRNIQRSRQRTTLTVGALMVGVAMVIMTKGMTESFASDLKVWIKSYLGGDIYVSSPIPLRSNMADRLKSVEGVTDVAPIRYFDVKLVLQDGKDEKISFMALDPVAYTKVTNFVFSDPKTNPEEVVQQLEQGKTVLISSVISEKFGFEPGDSIQLRTRRGVQDFKIAAVVVDFYNQGQVIQGSWDIMRRYFRINDASTYLVKVNQNSSVSSVQERIDQLYGKRYQLILESNLSIRKRVLNLMDQAFSLFDVMSLIAIVVGGLGIVNTLTMSVMERLQEIGMLRAIGMTRAQITRMILAEAGEIGIIGGILGLITGVILARILFIGMTTMSGYQLTFILPFGGVLLSIVAAFLISQLAALLPARRAAGVKILEAVQYE
jgi:putative ABC transport system permease protein